MEIVVISASGKGKDQVLFASPRYFAGWIHGTQWPEYSCSRAKALPLSPRDAASITAALAGRFKAARKIELRGAESAV